MWLRPLLSWVATSSSCTYRYIKLFSTKILFFIYNKNEYELILLYYLFLVNIDVFLAYLIEKILEKTFF